MDTRSGSCVGTIVFEIRVTMGLQALITADNGTEFHIDEALAALVPRKFSSATPHHS